MITRPRLLILSFSPIVGDARVLKQVMHFQNDYDVTTCGYGDAPAGVSRHIQIPDDKPQNDLYPRFLALRLFERVYWRTSAVAWCKAALEPGQWDVILANDVETVPLALTLGAAHGVHADLHEYSPRLRTENPGWMRWIAPYYRWMCRKHVSKASSWSTVSAGLARQYLKEYGFEPIVVTNAAPYWDLPETPVETPLRLVHSGAGLQNRELEIMIEAVAIAKSRPTLDLYLTANHPAYIVKLRERAAEIGRVTVHDPVPYSDLIQTLNNYDVGVFVLPPVNFSYTWALPNKIFDFIQARLAIVVGPSPEMASIVEEHGLGIVAKDFSIQALADAIDALTPESVAAFKKASSATAEVLNADSQIALWDRAIADLVGLGESERR
ncbi:MAG: glycosyltransferase [Leifsonia flava]